MYCAFTYAKRPPRSAKKSRALWDALTKAHGEEPESLGQYISEGGFRDWLYVIKGEMLEFEAGLIGGDAGRFNPEQMAQFSVRQLRDIRAAE